MRRIYAGLCLWNLLIWAATCVLGFLPEAAVGARTHALAGLFAAFFACLVPSILIAHFIGSMKWMQQTGRAAGIEDTRALRTAWVKGPLFPWLVTTALVAVATAITGARAATSAPAWWAHVALGVVEVVAIAVGLALSIRGLEANRLRMRGVESLVEERRRRGEVPSAEPSALLPESGRAGGRVFLFLALQAWILYAYVRFVLRRPDEPLWPYAAASLLLLGLGTAMLRAAGSAGPGSEGGRDQAGTADLGDGTAP